LRLFFEQIYASALSWQAEVFLSLESRLPLSPIFAKRKIVFVHDICGPRAAAGGWPILNGDLRLGYTWRAVTKAVGSAAAILTPSHFVADEVRDFFHVPASSLITVPLGVDHATFKPITDGHEFARLRKQYHLPEAFYLFVGNLSDNKNLALLVRTYATEAGGRDIFLPVVIVGSDGENPGTNPTRALIEETRQTHNFRFLGYVPLNEHPGLYAAAKALIHPSCYESFGLPPLEAMACGTPVVVSNQASLPEVVGDAALQIDPGRPESLVQALRSLNDESIRHELIVRGLERAKAFSWESTAQRIAEQVVGGGT
jgi:glycosyltransferase involved in cell wall biosynthesis